MTNSNIDPVSGKPWHRVNFAASLRDVVRVAEQVARSSGTRTSGDVA